MVNLCDGARSRHGYRCLKVPSSRVPCATRICTLERGQALTHGSRPQEARAVAAGGHPWDRHGCGSYCRTSKMPHHGELPVAQTRISKCGGSSDDIALTSRTRGWLSDAACVHLLRRVPSHRSSGLLVPQCQGSRFVARGGRARPIGGVYAHGCGPGTCSTFTGKPPKLPMGTVPREEESRTV
jgi:hypothetical protein